MRWAFKFSWGFSRGAPATCRLSPLESLDLSHRSYRFRRYGLTRTDFFVHQGQELGSSTTSHPCCYNHRKRRARPQSDASKIEYSSISCTRSDKVHTYTTVYRRCSWINQWGSVNSQIPSVVGGCLVAYRYPLQHTERTSRARQYGKYAGGIWSQGSIVGSGLLEQLVQVHSRLDSQRQVSILALSGP